VRSRLQKVRARVTDCDAYPDLPYRRHVNEIVADVDYCRELNTVPFGDLAHHVEFLLLTLIDLTDAQHLGTALDDLGHARRQEDDPDTCELRNHDPYAVPNRELLDLLTRRAQHEMRVGQHTVHVKDQELNAGRNALVERQHRTILPSRERRARP
jgi:hypothetical protein